MVTGAGGFIGSHLTERLVKLGAETRALVHYNSRGHRGWLGDSQHRDHIEFIAGDIRDIGSLRHAFNGVDVIFHLAALIAIPYSYRAPASYVETNVGGTFNVLQAALDCEAPCLVHTSTSEVYGTAQEVPIRESHSLRGQSPYAATKIGADKLAECFYLSFGLPVVTVRPFNTFGPRQSARAVIPAIITQGLKGDTVRLGSLEPTRDFNYVTNTVDGYIAAAQSPDAVGSTVNLGSGREISIGNLALLIGELVGRDLKIVTDQQRLRPEKSEVERLLADNSLAHNLIGWKPTVSLEVGLERSIAWIRDNMDRYHDDSYGV